MSLSASAGVSMPAIMHDYRPAGTEKKVGFASRRPLCLTVSSHMPTPVRDQFHRTLHDLRISVTDRCNFRCPYCMPKEVFGPGYPFLHDPQLMKLDELVRIVAAFRALGVEKVRITGGEPLLRADVPELIRILKQDLR